MAEAYSIRPFRADDEAALRQICFDTGFLGEPASRWVDMNQELFSDIWQLYYLRNEPDLIFVAERAGKLIGYVTGSKDTRAKERWMRTRFPLIALGKLLRGKYRFGKRTIGMLLRLLREPATKSPPLDEYAAHMHYNVLPGAQNRADRIGIRLTARLVDALDAVGVNGIHGFMAVRQKDLRRRYGRIAEVYSAQPTRVYANATDEPYMLVVVVGKTQPHRARRNGERMHDRAAKPNQNGAAGTT